MEQPDGIRDTPDICRLYRPEWTIAYVTTTNKREIAEHGGDPFEGPLARAKAIFEQKLSGRIRQDDWRLICIGTAEHSTVQLQLRLPVLKGEFKYATRAFEYAEHQGWTCVEVVPRNSKRDHELRAYGVRKLAA